MTGTRFQHLTRALVFTGLGLLFASEVTGQEAKDGKGPVKTASRITAVTVYSDSALVTREVDVPAGKGPMEIIVSPMPNRIQPTSVFSEGTDGIRVLATRYRSRPIKEDKREEVRKVEEEIKKNGMEIQKIQADIQDNTSAMSFLTKMEGFASANTLHATEKGKLDAENAIALAKYLKEERTTRVKDGVVLNQKMQQIQTQNEFLQRNLQELTSGVSRVETDALIVIEKVNEAAGKLRLNYLVDTANWRPQYKIRAGKDGKAPVKIEYLAAVFQQSGEDWNGVDLVLSTAQPMLNATPPDLKGLAVTLVPKGSPNLPPGVPGQSPGKGMYAQPNPGGYIPVPQSATPVNTVSEINEASRVLRKQAQLDANKKDEKKSNEIWNYVGNLEQAKDLIFTLDENSGKSMALADSDREGPSVAYRLDVKISIPSRNDEQILEVARIDLAPDYFYKAVPVLSPHVYRQAILVNKSKIVLLPGEATMYNETDFVGRMQLPLVAIGESFTVGFGTEPQLQVQRQLVEKSRTMQGGNQVLKYEYRILLSSFKQEPVKVQVWDRLPKGESEALGVTMVKASPEISADPVYLRQDRPNNLLRWDVTLQPESNGNKAMPINYDFRLELDKQLNIGSFQSK